MQRISFEDISFKISSRFSCTATGFSYPTCPLESTLGKRNTHFICKILHILFFEFFVMVVHSNFSDK